MSGIEGFPLSFWDYLAFVLFRRIRLRRKQQRAGLPPDDYYQ